MAAPARSDRGQCRTLSGQRQYLHRLVRRGQQVSVQYRRVLIIMAVLTGEPLCLRSERALCRGASNGTLPTN